MAELGQSIAAKKLLQELAIWSTDNHRPQLFLRDDDCIEISPALMRLSELCGQWGIPILLAIIPKFAKDELTDFILARPIITPAVHGYSHKNHAGADEKKTELGNHRPLSVVMAELVEARARLVEMFGERLSNLLVPPWNKFSQNVAISIGDVGFAGISGFGWKNTADIIQVNTHVDVIDWKNNKATKSIDSVISELTASMEKARQNNFAPIGILTHHLDHDEQCWIMLEALFRLIATQTDIEWVRADDLIGLSIKK